MIILINTFAKLSIMPCPKAGDWSNRVRALTLGGGFSVRQEHAEDVSFPFMARRMCQKIMPDTSNA